MGERLNAIDSANGGALDVSAVGQAAVDVLAMLRGQRPSRIVIDGQRKGTEAIDAVYHEKLAGFLRQMGLEDLTPPAPLSPV